MLQRFLATIGLCVLALAVAGSASADVWVEVGDAGDLPATAQIPTGNNPLTAIIGTVVGPGEPDMYCIQIDDPAAFSATTVGGAVFDTQLFLFRADGSGEYTNDDDAADGLQSTLPAGHAFGPQTPGLYYLAISGFNNDPLDAGGALIFPNTFPGVFDAFDGDPVVSWSGGGGTGDYTIFLTGANFCQVVPEPASLVIWGIGAMATAGFGLRRRLARKA